MRAELVHNDSPYGLLILTGGGPDVPLLALLLALRTTFNVIMHCTQRVYAHVIRVVVLWVSRVYRICTLSFMHSQGMKQELFM